MDVQPGTICLIKYPFTDQAVAKLRPALVAEADNPIFLALTDSPAGLAGMNVNFIQITSSKDPGLYNIVLDTGDPCLGGTGLVPGSTIRCWNINTIHKGLIERTLGKVSPALLSQVQEKLRARLRL